MSSDHRPVWLQENTWAHQILVIAAGCLLLGYGLWGLTSTAEPGLFYQVTLWAAVVAGILFLVSVPFGVRKVLKRDVSIKSTSH